MFVRKVATFITAAALTTTLGLGLAAADGKDLFKSSGCTKCHSVKAAEITKEDGSEAKGEKELSKAGAKLDKAACITFQKKESDLEGKKHPKKFGGSDADLDAICTWIATLK